MRAQSSKPAGRHDQCVCALHTHGTTDGSPFGSLPAEVAVSALAARHAPALSGEDVRGGATRPSRLPGRQDLLAAVDGYGGSLGAKETHLASSGVRIGHGGEKKTGRRICAVTSNDGGGKEVRTEVRNKGVEESIHRPIDRDRARDIIISMNGVEEGSRKFTPIRCDASRRHR